MGEAYLPFKIFRPALAALFLFCACTGDSSLGLPTIVFGKAEPVVGGLVKHRVSKEFGRRQARALYDALQSKEFNGKLAEFSCGEALPRFSYTVSLWEPAPYQQRHVQVQSTPSLERNLKNECLIAGLRYLSSVELGKVDEGVEVTFTAFDKQSGRKVTTSVREKQTWTKPWCDCARRDSGQSWVQFPFAISMTPNNSFERTTGLRPVAAQLMIR